MTSRAASADSRVALPAPRLLTAIATMTPAAATAQPSGETGARPQPNRRGPNHAFLPIRGEVRTTTFWQAGPDPTSDRRGEGGCRLP